MMLLFAGEGWGEGMSRKVINDEMWSRLEKLLPKPKGRHGKDERLFMEALCWMLRTGAAWRDLPPIMVTGKVFIIVITPGQVHENQVAHEVWANEHCEFFLQIRLTILMLFGRP